ncbi:MAG: DegT/DnrJ/EryC1/StrS family aminotransferase [Kovacikia sp.]
MIHLALLGGQPTVTTPFPTWPVFDQPEVEAVSKVVESGQWWMGKNGHPAVKDLEAAFAKFQSSQSALAVTNGVHALEIILRSLGIGPGDEVIVPAYAPGTTAMTILQVGATPILAEVKLDTMTLAPESLRRMLSPRTRAVIPVHLNGVTGEIDQILSIAQAHRIFVVEDCTHAHGAESRGRRVGSLGIAGAFDFQDCRMIAAGEGGMIVTRDHKLYEKCWSQHNCGRRFGKSPTGYYAVGTNYRMAPFQAAIARLQLERFKLQLPQRLKNMGLLDQGLSQIPGIIPQRRNLQDQAPAYLYLFRYDAATFNGLARDRLIAALQAEGVPCQIPEYNALHQLSLFQQGRLEAEAPANSGNLPSTALLESAALTFPHAELLAKTTIALPHSVMLGDAYQIQEIVEAVAKIQKYAPLLPCSLTHL